MSDPYTSSSDPFLSGFCNTYRDLARDLEVWARLQIGPQLRGLVLAEDVVQETWCRAFGAYARFDPERGTPRAWLFGIAEKVLLEEFRRRRPAEMGGGGPVASRGPSTFSQVEAQITSVAERAARRESVQAVVAAAEALPPEDRELLIWRGLEGRGFVELGARLGCEPEALRSRWRRLRARLQRQLG